MFAKASGFAAVVVLCLAGWASAIVVDGVNDFPPAALIDADGGDTEFAPIDLGDVYVTYDGTAIYIGYGHDHDGWTGVQVGIALVTTTAGGTTDPWGHQIGFEGMCIPDFIAYINLDSSWNEWCVWNGADWDRTGNILNWMVSTEFDEIELTYDLLGVDCHAALSQVFWEIWVTQDGVTKGPLDLSYNDDLQLSTPAGTTWDIATPVMISCWHCIDLYGPSGTENGSWSGVKNLWR